MRIIIVDNEPGIVKGIEFLLHAAGRDYNVIATAGNGIDGAQIISREHPDIVITDIRMPFCDGIEMIRRLKEKNEQAEFIMLSGYAEFEYARKAMELGVRFYLTKPLDEEEMYRIIEKIREEKKEQLYPEQTDVIRDIREYVSKNYAKDISLNAIAAKFYMNPNYLSQLIKKKTGKTYQNYITELRIGHAEKMLTETDLRISQVCEAVGYHDVRHFSELFERITGKKPTDCVAERKGVKRKE